MLPQFEGEDLYLKWRMFEEFKEFTIPLEDGERLARLLTSLAMDLDSQLSQVRENHYMNPYQIFEVLDIVIDNVLENKRNYSGFFKYISTKREKFNPNLRN